MDAISVQYVTTRDGFRIAWSEEGSGSPLLFMPATIQHLTNVREAGGTLTSDLRSRFRLLRFDHRGQGLSTRGLKASHVWEHYERDLSAVANVLGTGRFILLAPGMRAATALAYAARNPGRLAALVLLNPLIGRVRGEAVSRGTLHMAEDAWDAQLEAFARVTRGDVDPSEMKQRLLAATSQEDFVMMVRSFLAQGAAGLADRVRVPTLVILGSGPSIAMPPHETSQLLAATIPGSRLLRIGDWGELADAIETFVVAQSSTTAEPLPRSPLSDRELDVLRLVALGMTNKEIASDLFVSGHTVAKHVRSILNKTGAPNRAAAVRIAGSTGVLR